MHMISRRPGPGMLLAMVALSVAGSAMAQEQPATDPNIVVNGEPLPEDAPMTKGPEVKGMITARSGNQIQVTGADGNATVITVTDTTRIKSGGGFFGNSKVRPGTDALINGLPVTIKTMQSGSTLVASQIALKNKDLKTATMIRYGTAQGFAEQTAATDALRGRMGDIDQYNVKSTMNVYFDTAKADLSEEAKAQLCAAARSADAMDNALLLVVGYTDADGDDDYNQELSEKRAGRVINYLQQACAWKPYRVLTPTGMSESNPVASNDTEEGKAQNRRVAVNVLVSKGLDGL